MMFRLNTRPVAKAVVFAALAVIASGWALFFVHVTTIREVALDQARLDAGQRSALLREHAEQALETADIALRSLDTRPGVHGIQVGDDATINHLSLRWLRNSSALFAGIGLIDRNGLVVASADRAPPLAPVDLSDRDYFRLHRDDPDAGILIGAPFITQPNNILAMPISRRVDDENGEFAGVVAARLEPAQFESLYQLASADGVLLALTDGRTLVAVTPHDVDPIEDIVAQLPIDSPSDPASESTVTELTMAESGTDWLVGVSLSQKFPIRVAVAVNAERRLASWREERNFLAAAALASTLLVGLLAGVLLRRLNQHARMATELKIARANAEDERHAAEEARAAAEAANRAKTEFLAHVSHELRSPLNSICGYSDVMAREAYGPIGNPRYAEYAQIVHSSANYLLDIINNLLDLEKVDAGKWDVTPEPVDLQVVAEALRNLVANRAAERQLNLVMDVPDDLPGIITDGRLLLQILVNLTINAIKFTPKDGTVTVSVRSSNDRICFTVSDTGCGMTQDGILAAMEPFGHANRRQTDGQQETGLGLPLSKRFVSLLSGKFRIESTPGTGTVVTVTLPTRTPDTDARTASAA